MTNLKEQLRRAIEESRTEQTKWRCPGCLREKVVDYVLRRHQDGASVMGISHDLGLSSPGLRRWLAAVKTGGGFREVRVLDVPAQPRAVALVSPKGDTKSPTGQDSRERAHQARRPFRGSREVARRDSGFGAAAGQAHYRSAQPRPSQRACTDRRKTGSPSIAVGRGSGSADALWKARKAAIPRPSAAYLPSHRADGG